MLSRQEDKKLRVFTNGCYRQVVEYLISTRRLPLGPLRDISCFARTLMHQLVYNALIRIWVGRFAPSGGLYALLSDDNQIRPMNSSKYHILFPIGETFASWSIQQCI